MVSGKRFGISYRQSHSIMNKGLVFKKRKGILRNKAEIRLVGMPMVYSLYIKRKERKALSHVMLYKPF